MKALVYRGPFATVLEEVPEPVAAPGAVLVEVAAVGMCGSDVTAFAGHMDTARPGDVRGHEFAGRVVAAEGADDQWLVFCCFALR
jgi:threonine dehydrogenase-like Zn-dependent dehydrogenase